MSSVKGAQTVVSMSGLQCPHRTLPIVYANYKVLPFPFPSFASVGSVCFCTDMATYGVRIRAHKAKVNPSRCKRIPQR